MIFKTNGYSKLTTNFIPKRIIGREKEIKRLKSMIFTPLEEEGFGGYNGLFGYAGTGKTCVVKYLLNNTKIPKDTKVVYFNCRDTQTTSGCLQFLLNQFQLPINTSYGEIKVIKAWINTGYMLNLLHEFLRAKKLNLFVILDEVDKLLQKSGDSLLGNLVRSPEDVTISCLLISNDPMVKGKISNDVNDHFYWMNFPTYHAEQHLKILRYFSSFCLNDNSYSREVLSEIAKSISKWSSNIRYSKRVLGLTGKICEEEGRNKISINDVSKGIKEFKKTLVIESIQELPISEQILIESVRQLVEKKRNKRFRAKFKTRPFMVTFKKIKMKYINLSKKYGEKAKSERILRDMLMDLREKGMVAIQEHSKHQRGRFYTYNLGVSENFVKRALAQMLYPLGVYQEDLSKYTAKKQ